MQEKWCRHIKLERKSLWLDDNRLRKVSVENHWKFCPICSKRRPDEKVARNRKK